MCINLIKRKSSNEQPDDIILDVSICYENSSILFNQKGEFLILNTTFNNECSCEKKVHLSFPRTGEWVDCVKFPKPSVSHHEGEGIKTFPLAPPMIKSTIPIDFVLPAEGKVEGYLVVRIKNESNEWTMHADLSGQTTTTKINKSKIKIEECK